ncbi:MAG: hypothetical protein L6R37_007400 [Teloschistes peruensis]|nr:MAG: hypothetical protein L6R37_007400 [Teloschistes peruensis]
MAGHNIKIKKPTESICVTLRKINERLEELENEVYSKDQQIEMMKEEIEMIYDRIDELEKKVGSDERDEDDG